VTGKPSKKQARAKQAAIKSVKVDFADEPVTSFGGMALVERLALRLGLWTSLASWLPVRRGDYSWLEIVKCAVAGLLSGSRGTLACGDVREEAALQALIGVSGSPDETTFWRRLEWLGCGRRVARFGRTLRDWARRVLNSAPLRDVLWHGFVPLFGDGTLLEGSGRREATTFIKSKGSGLLWSTWFIGSVLAFEELAGQGGCEARSLRRGLRRILREVLDPLNLRGRALVLMDSLHGNGPTCALLEAEGVKYVLGANALNATENTLRQRGASEWRERGPRASLGWDESAVCVCWLQCQDWPAKRLLVGRRWHKDGELPGIYCYAGVLTNLIEADVAQMGEQEFADAIWTLYDGKAGQEDLYKDLLEDLGGHHPPCQELSRNRGYYTLLALAHTLARGVDLIGSSDPQRGTLKRADGGKRARGKPRRMRLYRLRRSLLALSGRVAIHAREAFVHLLGVGRQRREAFSACFLRLSRC